MESKQILSEAKDQLRDHQIDNFEELKSAIESKKLFREIEGMKFNRLIAFVSALTALGTLGLLFWQSGMASRAPLKIGENLIRWQDTTNYR